MTEPHAGLQVEARTEWLLTDGLGGYAMGNACSVNTRRYHALWMPAISPPTRRIVGLRTVIDELLLDSGDTLDLATGHFGPLAQLHPGGIEHLVEFRRDTNRVCWTYTLPDGGTLERALCIDAAGASVLWTLAGADATLIVRPLLTLRNAHHLLDAPTDDLYVGRVASTLTVARDGTEVHLSLGHGQWRGDAPDWWTDLRYPIETERGYDDTEAALAVGVAEVHLRDGETCSLSCSLARSPSTAPTQPTLTSPLHAAARQFIVTRSNDGADNGLSIIAGWPWFADWGRDAMISVPGLLLTSGRFDEAKQVLETFAGAMRNGLVPNRFDDVQTVTHYDTADASLWFIHALMAWMDASGEHDEALLDASMQIVEHCLKGTDFGIGIREGLVEAGEDGYALTWMDAKTEGVAITPRMGRPVELSALWHNALRGLAKHLASAETMLRSNADETEQAFGAFWNADAGCCFDVLGETPDASIRPNQLFACSLQHSPLSEAHRRSVLRVVDTHLLTPFGLRTLAPNDPRYIGTCEGPQAQRDKAYHNGTVWPWLIGAWLDARARLGEPARVPKPLLDSMHTGCEGQLAEIFDGDPPHTPRGCPAQAWSVAEVLRYMPEPVAGRALS